MLDEKTEYSTHQSTQPKPYTHNCTSLWGQESCTDKVSAHNRQVERMCNAHTLRLDRQIKTQVLYAMQSCTPVSDIIALHTFLRYIAFIFTHVQICQVALTRSTDEFPDGWPETGVHESVDTIVYWVNNEGDCCIRNHRQ